MVFAEWQGGDADAGDAALAATLRGFGEVAEGIPFAEWPRRFWAMLLAAPGLRRPASVRGAPASCRARALQNGAGVGAGAQRAKHVVPRGQP